MDRRRLVEGMVAGDQQAWRAFLDRFGDLIYSIARRTGLEGEEREELYQEACLRVVRSIDRLREPERLSTWLYSLTYRLALDHLAKRRTDPTAATTDLAPEDPTVSIEPTVLAELERLEQVAFLHDALDRIDARCHNLLQALYLEDPKPKYREISERLGLPVGSIGPISARCLRRLYETYKELSEAGPSPSNPMTRKP